MGEKIELERMFAETGDKIVGQGSGFVSGPTVLGG